MVISSFRNYFEARSIIPYTLNTCRKGPKRDDCGLLDIGLNLRLYYYHYMNEPYSPNLFLFQSYVAEVLKEGKKIIKSAPFDGLDPDGTLCLTQSY